MLKKPSLLTVLIILLFSASAILIYAAFITGTEYKDIADAGANKPIKIIGSYREDDGPWIELTEDTRFNPTSSALTIKGNFSRDIPENQDLLFYVQRLNVSLKIDGIKVYSFGEGSGYSRILRSPGTTWIDYPSKGISTDSEIELSLHGTQRNIHSFFHMTIATMQTGSYSGLYVQMIRQNGHALFFCIFLIFISVIALLLAIIAYLWRMSHSQKSIALAFFSVMAALAILTDLNLHYMPLLITNPVVLSVLRIIILYLCPCAFLLCILSYTGDSVRKIVKTINIVMCTLTAVMFILQCFGIIQLYNTQLFYWPVSILLAALASGFITYDAFKYKNTEAKFLLFSLVPITVFSLLDIFRYLFLAPFPYTFLFGIGASITLTLQIFHIISLIKRSSDTEKQKLQLENDLFQSRIAVMLSQIQPHFLYNSLLSIQALCRIDPNIAHQAVGEFSKYMRGNIDSLSVSKPIPFAKELEHVEHYLALEKMRFGNKLEIIYDINVQDFMLPVLTLQPIVENAVRHGVMKLSKGGAVLIKTEETENMFLITVTDNGIGFRESKEERIHVGLENVRYRLASMCAGRLEIENKIEGGTTVKILIPKI
jgi:signal transduction histidine kinase